MKNKMIAVLLSLVMIITFQIPCYHVKASGKTPTVTVDGVKITSSNAKDVTGDGIFKYDISSNTLFVLDATSTSTATTITSTGDLNIELIRGGVFAGGLKITANGSVRLHREKEGRGGGTIYGLLDADVKGDFIVDLPNDCFFDIEDWHGNIAESDVCSIKARNIKINASLMSGTFQEQIRCYSLNLEASGDIDISGDCEYSLVYTRYITVSCGGDFNVRKIKNEYHDIGINTRRAKIRVAGKFLCKDGFCVNRTCDIEAGSIEFGGMDGFKIENWSSAGESRIVSTKGDIKISTENHVIIAGTIQSARDFVIEHTTRGTYAALKGYNATVSAKRNISISTTREGFKAVSGLNGRTISLDFGNQLDLKVQPGSDTGISAENVILAIPKENKVVVTDKDGKLTISNATPVAKPDSTESKKFVNVSYRTHVQTFGWQNYVSNGKMAGTSGKAKRLEGIEIKTTGNDKLGVAYTTHCQSYGWLPWSTNGEMNGTEGEAKRLEAIKIQLTGAQKNAYDIYYRVHAQSYGWLGWAKNGEPAGTAGYSKRLEGIQIVLVPKNGKAPSSNFCGVNGANSTYPYAYYAKKGTSPVVNAAATSNQKPVIPGIDKVNVAYRTHIQTYGWQGWKYNKTMSGTSGQAKRLEAIQLKLTNNVYGGSICYTTHVQSYGWQGNEKNIATWKKDGDVSGTSGKGKRLEAIRIGLTGEVSKHYDVYYRVHAQTYGWLGWAKNGEPAGTSGLAKRLEAIEVVLVPKGASAPGSTKRTYIKK